EASFYLREKGHGLWVHKERFTQLQSSKQNDYHIEFDGYTFYKNRDSPGYTTKVMKDLDLQKLRRLADADKNCVAFNTNGELKNKIVAVPMMRYLNPVTEYGGIYVKNSKTHFRVKMLCNWCSSKQLCAEWY